MRLGVLRDPSHRVGAPSWSSFSARSPSSFSSRAPRLARAPRLRPGGWGLLAAQPTLYSIKGAENRVSGKRSSFPVRGRDGTEALSKLKQEGRCKRLYPLRSSARSGLMELTCRWTNT